MANKKNYDLGNQDNPKQDKKGITRDTFLMLFVVGLVIFLAVYFGIYMKYNDKAEALASSNAQLAKEVEELKVHYDKLDTYRQETKEVVEAIREICAQYPADAREEDGLMVGVSMQENSNINFSTISLAEPRFVYSVAEEMVAKGKVEELTQELVLTAKDVTYLNTTTYGNLKACIEAIQQYRRDQEACIGIRNIRYSYSEANGTLEGTIDTVFYSMQGTGREYVGPEIPEYISGISDLFEPSVRR